MDAMNKTSTTSTVTPMAGGDVKCREILRTLYKNGKGAERGGPDERSAETATVAAALAGDERDAMG